MAQQPGSIPKYFTQITTIRFLAQTIFITTAVLQSRTTNKLMDMHSWELLSIVGIEAYDRRLLRAAYYLESLFALAASVWAWMNVITEATQTTRRSGLKWCFRVDLVGTIFSVISLILQATAGNGTQCNGYKASDTIDLGPSRNLIGANEWCHRFYDNFNLTILMLVLCAIPLYLESRWFYHRRLAESRAVSDDWTKNHTDRRQAYLKFLQRAAAPFRFFWRCCCKLGHSSKNPTAWAILYGFFLVPLIIVVAFHLFVKGFKLGIKGIKKTMELKADPDSARRTGKSATSEDGTEMVRVLPKDSHAALHPNGLSSTPYTSGPLSDFREDDTTAPAPPPVALSREHPPAQQSSSRVTKPKKPPKAARSRRLSSQFPLADLLAHPNLFFELISHLHGADLRVLSKLSKPIRSIILAHRSTYGTAMQSYICSRRPPALSEQDSSHHTALAALLGTNAANPPISTTTASTTTTAAAAAATPATIIGHPVVLPQELHYPDVPTKAPCWGCGIRICGSCAKPKSNLKVSRTEIRLRYLEPVCNSCYFRCLCGPAYEKPKPKPIGRKRKRKAAGDSGAAAASGALISPSSTGTSTFQDPTVSATRTPAPATTIGNPTTPPSTTSVPPQPPDTNSSQPTHKADAQTLPNPHPTAPLRKIFPSLSQKCLCTTPKPPRATKYLCRDCENRHLTDLWKLRVRRNAPLLLDELPENPTLEAQEGNGDDVNDGSDDDEGDDGSDGSDDNEDQSEKEDATASNDGDEATHHPNSSLTRHPHPHHPLHQNQQNQQNHQTHQSHTTPKRKPKPKPTSAFNHTNCTACNSRLHILQLPSLQSRMTGSSGKTRGLRWWRCRRCGLEARDTLMSLRREFP